MTDRGAGIETPREVAEDGGLVLIFREIIKTLKSIETQVQQLSAALPDHVNDIRWAGEAANGEVKQQIGKFEKEVKSQFRQLTGLLNKQNQHAVEEISKAPSSGGAEFAILFLLFIVIGLLIFIAIKVH